MPKTVSQAVPYRGSCHCQTQKKCRNICRRQHCVGGLRSSVVAYVADRRLKRNRFKLKVEIDFGRLESE